MMAPIFPFALLVGLCVAAPAPAPAPEVPGANGQCERPIIYVDSVVKSGKQGPYLVSGARADANPNGGESPRHKQYAPPAPDWTIAD